ncbi:MAG: LLM class flavin-dependent oxidoreductase [Mycobacterium sp.]|jgi:hypothetical protein|uniref:LLM class flavin-dependent oxidoreductase n=1 Tax=Mycobacterium sp. TaxID=1785 RepID=UPI00389AA326
MEISVVVASRPNRPPEQDLSTAVVADRLGFGEVWVSEGWVWDCFVLATAIGLATDHIALTIGPVPVSLRDPAMIGGRGVGGRPHSPHGWCRARRSAAGHGRREEISRRPRHVDRGHRLGDLPS